VDEILTAIQSKVFECVVDGETAARLSNDYPVINMRPEGNKTFLRLVSDKPPCEEAVPVQAALEDLYLYNFSGVNKNE
jgi:ABC-2 type transport system ATP-binding protein